jgi:hypothetical protein
MTDEPDTGARSLAASTAATPVPQPTPVIPVSQSSTANPPGSAAPSGDAPAVLGPPDHPEFAVGAAFAGGLVLAMILKRITN